MADTHRQFVAACRAAYPGITQREIGAATGLTQQAISVQRYDVEKAVERWNAGGRTRVVYVAARVELSP